jgi:hypothetical protein
MTHGIKAAGTRPGLDQGKGEPGVQWEVKRQRTCKEMPKVTRCTTGADEVVVANIPGRGGSNVLPSEGLHMMRSFKYHNLKRFKDDFCGRTEDATDYEVAGNGGL